jgi:hypothetical protein
MTGLTAEQQFELRAKKALETGDASFKPRGQANKALFENMKEEFEAAKKHTTAEVDRVIKEITPVVALFNGSGSTNPQERINSRLLQNAANCKANKDDRVLIREQKANAKAKGKAKGKADHKSVASTATASTAPSEQMDNEIEDDDIIEVPLLKDDDSSDEAMPLPAPQQSSEESSDDCGERKRKHPRSTLTSHVPKKIALAIHPHANVAWAETCDDTEKEHLLKPIKDVTALLKDCGHFYDVKRTFNDRLPGDLNWPRGYELNWKEYELAVYIHRESPYPFRLGELLCKVSRSV